MKLSIITVNKNNVVGLEKTIQSVINQTFKDFEYIIIDGSSTDGSVETIKKYDSLINYWVSEPDSGIYNAMNKGILKAVGEYCLFLNSGDCLISSTTLDTLFIELNNYLPADIFYSDRINNDNTIVYFPANLTIIRLIDSPPINHQNSLIRRSLFLEHGLYNEKLRLASDWEFFLLELWKYKSKFFHIKTNISFFDLNGLGSQNTTERSLENITIFKNVFHELSELILEIRDYHDSIYYSIILNYGTTKLLIFILRSYRFVIKKTRSILKFFNRKVS